ncbi:hypothetical protein JOD43_003842 [Pullulanibacillus pueri]|uniref:DUF4127 family protein n=1 Tax=Pullulanibacillus pueri TaxID=1437324 RepID=A0A8J3A083_9BACL|nr:DUF4127 family protein [Pullulanibacillus pueri]MBM7683662.1 hypothetical protein [Pullulanibacillus pueri]GGH87186.1 hypothetical protein GCM10007096_36620 [Pullulanibacillus pueri]
MTKIVFLPLDERPCNYDYPKQLASMTELDVVLPQREILGKKKLPAQFSNIRDWLVQETRSADYLILSIDMLVYGGIVPSRLHHLSENEWRQALNVIREMKENNPSLKIYAFNLIMRAPAYNNSEEEPAYYSKFGRAIYRYGWLMDKKDREGLTKIEREEQDKVVREVPDEILRDFLNRRKMNAKINHMSIDLVNGGLIDFLIIPLDDNSKYGFTSKEQRTLIFNIEEKNLFDKVHIYPGADEIGCTLLARVFAQVNNYTPLIHARYSSTQGPLIIPKYEDRSLNESLKAHVTAIGGILTDTSISADVHLFIHSPAVGETEVAEQGPYDERHRSYFSEINIREIVHVMDYLLKENKFVALADVATCNGSDRALMKLMAKIKLHNRLHAYGGWNTSGNTMGTVLAHGIIGSFYFNRNLWEKVANNSRKFYTTRIIEDWGYQAVVRQEVVKKDLPRYSANYFNINGAQKSIEACIQERLNNFVNSELQWKDVEVSNVQLPWKRMFEVGFQVDFKNT